MKKALVGGALALMAVAGTAHAAPTPTISFNTSSTATNPVNTNIIYNFDNIAAGTSIGINSTVTNGSAAMVAVRPAVFSSGNYAQAGAGGLFSLSFAPTSVLSFALGSLDQYNYLTLSFSDLTSVVLQGGQITNDLNFMTNGRRDGVVTYTVASNALLTGVSFSSGANAFEIDNVAVGVPEPAAWGMMILGFGLVGGVLRRRSPAKVKFA